MNFLHLPVLALLKFRWLHVRRQRNYYVAELIHTLSRQVDRHAVVVFKHQTSHAGSPANEFADVMAEIARADQEYAYPRVASESFRGLRSAYVRSGFRL